jgi:hypothetical protein
MGGGKCGQGAAAAGFAVVAGGVIKTDNMVAATIGHAIAGGIGAQLSGGKFGNGALTGAFGYLFNSLMHPSPSDSSIVVGMRNAILSGNMGALETLLMSGGSGLTAAELIIAQRALAGMQAIGPKGAELLASRYGVNFMNSVNHAFGQTRHNLAPLIEEFGSATKAFLETQKAVDVAFAATRTIPNTVQVGAHTVTVRGAIVDGIPQIRTLFMPKQ